jgi:histidinol dehydrogenase
VTDLISQVEHGLDCRSPLSQLLKKWAGKQLSLSITSYIARTFPLLGLREFPGGAGEAIVVSSVDEAYDFLHEYAFEHVEVST